MFFEFPLQNTAISKTFHTDFHFQGQKKFFYLALFGILSRLMVKNLFFFFSPNKGGAGILMFRACQSVEKINTAAPLTS